MPPIIPPIDMHEVTMRMGSFNVAEIAAFAQKLNDAAKVKRKAKSNNVGSAFQSLVQARFMNRLKCFENK